MIRVLHTADWHLGKKLEQSERTDEHEVFLNWLIDTLVSECVDVLIIAGDVFDTGSPSNVALAQYYRFLRRVKDTCCREVIIIGGNHDSISTLNAPRELLKYYNVHITGGVPDDFTEQIITVKDIQGEVALVVCAVPFLRDRDVRLSVSGETAEEREARIRQGICQHYHRFIDYISPYKARCIPVIATGHLFAAGSSTSDSEKEIHVGNLGQVCGDQFPAEFDYVALGHIHRPQTVNRMNHIRYSGSPIPLSFSEYDDRKQVVVLDFDQGGLASLRELEVPACRKLIRVKGDLEEIKRKILLLEDARLKFATWVEVQVYTEQFIVDMDEQLEFLRKAKPFVERFFTRQVRTKASSALNEHTEEALALNDLDPKEVFKKRCEAECKAEEMDDMLDLFNEVLEKMAQREG